MKEEPKYIQIKNDIKANILKGHYKVGDKIPSEVDLRDDYVVSRHTIREAIGELVNEGYLYKQQGSGTYVSDDYKTKITSETRKKIGVITTYLSDYIFPSIIRGIEEELAKNNFSLMLSSTRNNVDNERISLDMMLEQKVDGLIIEPTKSNLLNPNLNYYLNLIEQKTPLVMINASYEELDLPVIGFDDVKAGYLATKHLIDLNHKEIGLIIKTDDIQGKNRLKGYLRALNESSLSFRSEHIIRFDTESEPFVAQEIQRILNSEHRPSAFVTYNDKIAVTLIKEIQRNGLNCPEDISIASHDNSFYSTIFPSIQLTSVDHPKEKLGVEAARWIMDAVNHKSDLKKPILFEPKLVVGNSSKFFDS